MVPKIPQIISAVSTLNGLVLFVASSMFVDHLRPTNEHVLPGCPYGMGWKGFYKKFCTALEAGTAAGSMGIVMSLVQVLFGVYAVMKLKTELNMIWHGIHALFCLLSLICFSIGIHFQDWYKWKRSEETGWDKLSETTPQFFYAITMIDSIFCVVAIFLCVTLRKKKLTSFWS